MLNIRNFALVVASAILLAACSSPVKLDDKAVPVVDSGANNGAEYGPLPYGGVRVPGPDQYRSPFGGDASDSRLGDLECAREIERAILNEGPTPSRP